MSGNVYQRVQEWAGLYTAEAVTDPTGPAEGCERRQRGGWYNSVAAGVRAARRVSNKQTSGAVQSGIRCCRSLPTP